MATAQFVHDGKTIDYIPGADVTAGDVIVQGDLVGVAKLDIKASALGSLALMGVFDFAKEADVGVTFVAGALSYWDEANKVAVTSNGGGAHKLLGKVVVAAADGDATVRVRLCPCALPAAESGSSSGS
jgi:predicted RecA/RadA family phage recombinase